ncbi:CMGC/CK2 protein kinase [Edhazardia aedis USNM 41457]|uniref:Casein kinase II subunit alpha n=1 Tax=Edhazardia aedis (strain USNM 41457) TaxID=1003232 RepID=J8ZSH3_EDHAE|nr:CMGC/CK2 protein kinase [Edhazardia aedis USNM 41457]|eukprot:EJW02593.1 CMGC/CK2 protein kinase [Edhazardia aedis USNM 41457]
MKITQSRVYSDVLAKADREVYDYKLVKVPESSTMNYKIYKFIGRGRFSLVFEGNYRGENTQKVVVKVLKPVPKQKIMREIAVLTHLSHKNIVKLLDVTLESTRMYYSLIFEFENHLPTVDVLSKASLADLKMYSRQILEALDYTHSRGVMHRDIKPQNIIINVVSKQLKLIDWGLADFYFPQTSYSCKMGTKYYKSPELLMEYTFYNYSIDIWSFGCILLEAYIKKRPFFRGSDNSDVLYSIIVHLGLLDLRRFLNKYDVESPISSKQKEFSEVRKIDVCVSESEFSDVDNDELRDLLRNILIYDHVDRFTAAECLKHKFLSNI